MCGQHGDIFYRQTTDLVLLEDISQDISQYFPKSPFPMVATWDPMAYYGSTSEKGNTFQAVLTTDSKMFYTILSYWDIQWTTGAASNGDAETGLGGTPAHAGFNSGDDTNFYNIPGSQTNAIINITTSSNVKVPGRWVFQVDDFQVTGELRGVLQREITTAILITSEVTVQVKIMPTSIRAIKLQLRHCSVHVLVIVMAPMNHRISLRLEENSKILKSNL
ncbi:PREDICTED: sushi, nidogen and EGF-like domain-containing protein 1 [Pseudopodoces humilis]|uniref:sushi, nidogen and EGF-like domain-containing protein 1 n=1 Tax=Pseudopodoces humilis TaxID=181119 RepID=UPI0006B73EF5|nr:PREDICTED: sushi, nidogen and EGF-like domain-containing protein 1 [Pseudopodoces humilis]